MFCTRLWAGELSDSRELPNGEQGFTLVPWGRLPLVDAEPAAARFHELPRLALP